MFTFNFDFESKLDVELETIISLTTSLGSIEGEPKKVQRNLKFANK